jgi:hypothetical protein
MTFMSEKTGLNPVYARSLDTMANTLAPALGGPITEDELAALEMPMYRTTAEELPAIRAGMDARGNVQSLPVEERELLQGIAAPTLTTKRHKLPKVIEGWQNFAADIRPQVVRTGQIVAFATRQSRDMSKFGNTEALAFYDPDRAVALGATMRIMFSRLDNWGTEHLARLGADPTTMLYKRVAKPALDHGLDINRVLDVPTEGMVSVGQAISQIEADFVGRGVEIPERQIMARAAHSYTAAVTYGYFGEMSLRGFRFGNLFEPSGAMTSRYHAFFTHLQVTHQSKEKGFVPANDGEGCPAARRAPGASTAVVNKFLSPFFSVEQDVVRCFEEGRARRPELRTFSPATVALSAFDSERHDRDICRRIPVLPNTPKEETV